MPRLRPRPRRGDGGGGSWHRRPVFPVASLDSTDHVGRRRGLLARLFSRLPSTATGERFMVQPPSAGTKAAHRMGRRVRDGKRGGRGGGNDRGRGGMP